MWSAASVVARSTLCGVRGCSGTVGVSTGVVAITLRLGKSEALTTVWIVGQALIATLAQAVIDHYYIISHSIFEQTLLGSIGCLRGCRAKNIPL